jgi:nitrite reductase (NO-forming)
VVAREPSTGTEGQEAPMTTDDKPREVWIRRVAIGLPVVVVALAVLVVNQIGGILIAKDLRADYEQLMQRATELSSQPDTDSSTTAAAASSPSAPDERPEIEVALVLDDLSIEADVDEIPAWATVTFTVVNEGAIPHDAAVGSTGSAMLNTGESDTFTVDAPGSGELTLICTVPGHESGGMRLALPIIGGDAEPVEAATDPGAGGETTVAAASADNADAYDGDKPPLERRDPMLPPAPGGDVHDITWTIEERVMQVAEDVWQEVWTFEGEAPGPTLRVNVGDTINLTLKNPEDARVGHSIDFHASQVAWNDEMRTINPGEELLYSFEATHAGVFMYHCGTAPALHHIGNAMHGLIVVEPEGGLPDVDHEFFFVQHEYYLGPQGEPGALDKMAKTAAEPDLVVFNGVANQYLDEPIEVGVEDSIRAWVVNNGPSADSSFHVVGTIFDAVVKEGMELSADNPGRWGSQALDLAPAQGGYVEFTLATDGLYPIVTHAFNHTGAGALGLFKAGDGGDAAGAEH